MRISVLTIINALAAFRHVRKPRHPLHTLALNAHSFELASSTMLRGILHCLLSLPFALALLPVSPTPLPFTFPQPFDSSLSYNLSSSCVAFLASVVVSPQLGGTGTIGDASLDDGTLPDVCRPFGLLLGTSSDWSQLARNTSLLNVALSDLCASTSCSSFMSRMATQMQQKTTCGGDLAQGKAVAVQALQGGSPVASNASC